MQVLLPRFKAPDCVDLLDLLQVRAKTKPASMRLPLEDDQDVATTMGEGGGAQAGGAAAAASAAAVNFEPVDSEKVLVLSE